MRADLAILGATVWTGADPIGPQERVLEPTALAVAGDRIVAVGSDEEIRTVCDARTEVVDGRGRLLLPGIIDSHVHPPMAGVEMVRCDLTGHSTRQEYVEAVARYATRNPDAEWIRGGGWAMAAFPNGLPEAADLDAVVGSRPVFLPNRDHHSAWVSSRALELAGIDASTHDPIDGRIERDGTGRPTGALHEGAMTLVERILPPLTHADFVEGILAAQRYLHSLGITAWQDAWVALHGDGSGSLDAYLSLASSGQLTARVATALWWERERGEEQVDDLLAARARVADLGSDRLRATSVKIMQDGVCETFTAAMLTPYLDVHGHETDNCGLSFVEPEALGHHVRRLDAEGFQVHVHALGDRAVREALDAIELARSDRAAGSGPGGRHHIAHLQVVHPDDLARFAPLGVTANFQPLWACEDAQMVELTVPFLGAERAAQQYPIASLERLGTALAFGSDWPVSTPDPFAELHVAVHRTPAPGHEAEERAVFLPDERVTLETALRAFTSGSAYVNHLEDECGSLEPGKAADLVMIDRDVRAVSEHDGGVASASVLMTMVGGRVVHEGV